MFGRIVDCFASKRARAFAAGILFGTAGISVLSSKDAKKAYTHCTAAALRAKKKVVDRATTIQENCEDIYAGAKAINEERELEEEYLAEFENDIASLDEDKDGQSAEG